MPEKIIGYTLLIVGVVIILFSGLSVYQVFTKQAQPVELFNFSGISLDVGALMASSLPAEARNAGISVPSSKQEIVSKEMVNQPMNLFAYTILMGFLATVGLKLAQIGTLLIRPINVQVKEAKPPESH